MKYKLIALIAAVTCALQISAERVLTLQECREMGKKNSKQAQINQEDYEAAKALRQAAFANFFPRLTANAGYVWNQKNISLLAEDALLPVGGMGADGSFTATDPTNQWSNSWTMLPNGTPAPLDADGNPFDPTANPEKIQWKNYAYLPKEAMEFDIHNMFAVSVGITQPIFMGGKLRQLYNIAKANEQIASIKANSEDGETLVSVDEAYWRVVSVTNKLRLAEQYRDLLVRLNNDVQAMVDEGVATKADLLKVRVKLNETEMTLAQAQNGLTLSKMALCQVCGMPLDSQFEVDDTDLKDITLTDENLSMDGVYESRKEIQMLEQAEKIAKSGVRIAASQFMPNIVATATYTASNPNIFNGFDKSLKGFFNAGVVVNVPLAHANDFFEYRAAKHKAKTVSLQLDEAREKIELQANQSNQKVNEANKKLLRAQSNLKSADENLRMAQESFTEGVIPSSDLMQAQTAWLAAHSDEIDAAIEVKITRLYLLKNTGKL